MNKNLEDSMKDVGYEIASVSYEPSNEGENYFDTDVPQDRSK